MVAEGRDVAKVLIRMGGYEVGDGQPLLLIAGPCVIESEAQAISHARKVQALAQRHRLPVIFKASFDKANRTSGKSFRGVGLKAGLAIFERVKGETGLPCLTDERVAYMGDDVNDLAVLGRVGLAACPADACPEVRTSVHLITKAPGGRGAVRELCELILRAKGLWKY